MTEKVITCITCPIGCDITVRGDGDRIISMEGHECKRGEAYAKNEYAHPMRILTSTIKLTNAAIPLVPVRSSAPLPKDKLFACMDVIRGAVAAHPVASGDVLIRNILDTGVDIIATATI